MLLLAMPLMVAFAQAAEPGSATETPGFQLVENRVYYSVAGENLKELKQQLQQFRLSGEPENYSTGQTEQHFESSYLLDPQPEGCRLKNLSVKVQVTIRLPQWRPRRKPAPEMKQRWEHMMAGLTRHEEGHRDHAEWAGRELHRRLAALDTTLDCKALRREVERADFLVMLRLQMREQIYEDRTQYGIGQGSVF